MSISRELDSTLLFFYIFIGILQHLLCICKHYVAFYLLPDTMHTAKAPTNPPKNIPEIIPTQNIKSFLYLKNICRLIMPEKMSFYPC